MFVQPTKSLKELRNVFKNNLGSNLSISKLGTFEISNDGKVFMDEAELETLHLEIINMNDCGEIRFDRARHDFYFKNGRRAFTIFVK